MALQKQPVALNFIKGIDTKTDAFQLPVDSFLTLINSVFTTSGRLTKRNGFKNITALPNAIQTTLTTLNDNLIATGSNLYAFSEDTNQWLNQGTVQPVQLAVQPMVRVSTSQQSPDTAIASNGLACLAYIDNSVAYYQISDSRTGQQIVPRTALPSTAINPRVFVLGVYFIITFAATVAATPTLQYIAIPTANPSAPQPATNITTTLSSLNAGYDGYVLGLSLYLAWGATSTNVSILYLTSSLALSAAQNISSSAADIMSVTADPIANSIWISYWDNSSTNGYAAAFNTILGQLMAPTQIITGVGFIPAITSVATGGILYVFYEKANNYPYVPNVETHFISKLTVTLPASGTGTGTASSTTDLIRSVGLASKAFLVDGVIYMLTVYGDEDQSPATKNSNQSTYFLVDGSGNIYMRLSQLNAGGYVASQVLPSVSLLNGIYYISYLTADFLTGVNKGTNLPTGTPTNALYTQYGINLAMLSLNTFGQHSSEIAGALHLTGGQLWEYDGVRPVEHGFHVYPENAGFDTATTGGHLAAQVYYYVFTYEWTDNQGNLHRSAPSIPLLGDIHTSGTSTNTNTLSVPTLRLTYKVAPNPVRIVGYRWSTAQQVYYQFTSVTNPTINDPTIDYVTIVDTLSDASILGQTLLYTTGGVIEDIAAPASIDSTLFDNRLWLIDAEDRNLLWYSKQVIEAVPVEMSDILTIYVAPTTGAQGSTGPMACIFPMDDKLVIFKKDAVYYINGNGPDNTGANSTYSQPVFITGAVGSTNPDSIVLIPSGLMFQSDKGIWLLGRDLNTTYIGAPVEGFNSNTVMSATAVPGTTQVRFVLNNDVTLMYDYFFNQWGTHTNISAISATLYQGSHTYLNSIGQIFQETPGMFLDGSEPVLMGLTTAWVNIAGLQGFERFYFANLLGTYITPFRLNVSLAYNYNSSPIQSIIVTPQGNPGVPYGEEALWGSGGPWGGSEGNVFQARIFPSTQKCQSFQVTIQELYDPTLGQAAGQGLSLSGLALIIGVKKGYRTQKAARSFG